ncbi:hypothetical protein QTJ16_006564 [Diplocarpon rosae]|uniref:Uncharacterized protein n=1 Tax=Diplocarpon rosae TaxID=946125 RepID=A0AAD9SWE0_9HELO|nr:hypothetical protein QTJ16_006564 [Diplocarpon rosae]
MLSHIKNSIRSRRQSSRPQSEMLRMRDDTDAFAKLDAKDKQEKQDKLSETIGVFSKFRRSGSLREILHPPILQARPLTFTNLFAAAKRNCGIQSEALEEVVPENGASTPLPIKRKPINPSLTDPFFVCEVPKFDAQAPRTDPSMMRLAKCVLKHRYTTKFDMDGFEFAPGVLRREYYFIWASDEELDRKVMEDVIWVRERYAQAGKGEPDDNDVISWYLED